MALLDGKPSILFGVPSTLGNECVELGCWLWSMGLWLGRNGISFRDMHGSPRSPRILLNRNSLAEHAIRERADFLLMVDPDMVPDIYSTQNFQMQDEVEVDSPALPGQMPFLPMALEFFKSHPCSVLAAPAVGDMPKRRLNVYPLEADQSMSKPATHEYAEKRVREGNVIEKVAAIGTGLIMIPTPVFQFIKRPFFDDVYNEGKTTLELSQDVYFTNTCHQAGIDVYCAWCSFCGHKKTWTLGCPGIDTLFAPRSQAPKTATTKPDLAAARDQFFADEEIKGDGKWKPLSMPVTLQNQT